MPSSPAPATWRTSTYLSYYQLELYFFAIIGEKVNWYILWKKVKISQIEVYILPETQIVMYILPEGQNVKIPVNILSES